MKPFKDSGFVDFFFTVLVLGIMATVTWYGYKYIRTNDANINAELAICDSKCYPYLNVGRNSRTQECICDTTKILKKRDNNE